MSIPAVMNGSDEREQALFILAVTKLPAERTAFLDRECAGNAALRGRLETLLNAHENPDPLLEFRTERPQPTRKLQFDAPPIDEAVGQSIGRYKLLERVGEGGWGVVYVAEQTEPVRRRVALKVIKLGMDTKAVVARFEAERQALAMMDHPNIAKVLDAGSTDTGRPFFVMELVRGIKITDYCDQSNLPIHERLDLFIKVCQAIQHAHQKGVIHRDIKPSNILVTLHDGVPVPKVIDFGIAKATEGRLTDATVYTQLHQFIGTPAYMSPEQAEMSGLDVDTRSDIYSLGVLLYELLTGNTPFDAKELMASGIDVMRKTIREKEALRPSTRLATLQAEELTTTAKRRSSDAPRLIHLLKGDLDWIVMKCLEKDRTRRYETAIGLAADLLRHLQHEPVLARPPSVIYRLQKAFYRNRVMYSSAAVIALSVLAALAFSGFSYLRERRARISERIQRQEAEKQRQAAEDSAASERQHRSRVEAIAYSTDMNLVLQSLEINNLGRGQELLERNRPREGQPDRRGWEWRYLWLKSRSDELGTLGSHDLPVTALEFSAAGNRVVSGSFDGKVKLWNCKDRFLEIEWETGGVVFGTAFSPDGRSVAALSHSGSVRLWDVTTKRELNRWEIQTDFYSGAIAFSPTGDRLVFSTYGGNLEVWNLAPRSKALTLSGHKANIRSVLFSKDGKRLFSAGEDQTIRIWDLESEQNIVSLTGHTKWISGLALSPNESRLVSSSADGTIRIWDLDRKEEARVLTNQTLLVWDAKFSPDGRFLATCGVDQRIHLWDTASWQEIRTFKGHSNEVWRVAFSPDGKTLASGSKDETIKLWELNSQPTAPSERVFSPGVLEVGLTPTTHSFMTVSRNRLTLGDTRSLSDLKVLDLDRLDPTYSNPQTGLVSERTLFLGYQDGRVCGLDFDTGTQTISFTSHPFAIGVLALSRDGARLASGSTDGTVLIHDTQTGKLVATLTNPNESFQCLCLSRNGSLLAGGSHRDELFLWDIHNEKIRYRIYAHKGKITDLDFSPDGRLLATSSWDGTAALWEVASGRRLASLRAHLLGVNAVAFSLDGRRLAAGTGDGFIKLWNVADYQEVLTLTGHHDINRVAFLPDDETLVSLTPRSIQLWPAPRLTTIAEIERRSSLAP